MVLEFLTDVSIAYGNGCQATQTRNVHVMCLLCQVSYPYLLGSTVKMQCLNLACLETKIIKEPGLSLLSTYEGWVMDMSKTMINRGCILTGLYSYEFVLEMRM